MPADNELRPHVIGPERGKIELVKEFEMAWQRGEKPVVRDYLQAASLANVSLLPELVRLDLQRRVAAGESARVEGYLATYPELARATDDIVELIVTEYQIRRPREPDLTPQEYLSRFPQYETILMARLRVLTESQTETFSGTQPGENSPASKRSSHSEPLSSRNASGSGVMLQRLGSYELLGELGRGGMGIVYRAHDSRRNVVVALKTLPNLDPVAMLRFKQEFRALATVAHPNLVTLYELVADGPQWFFVMELVEGVNFLDYVRQGRDRGVICRGTVDLGAGMPTQPDVADHGVAGLSAEAMDRLRDVLRQLAESVEALHQAEKLHRDIKPSNVLVTPAGRLVLLDFGMVAELDRAGLHKITEYGRGIVGTVPYMAPEQAGGRDVSKACDWYSVGVMLYEALTGRLPYQGSATQILRRKQQADPPPPSELVDGVPEDLERLCLALLSRAPEERPTGKELRRRLQRAPPDDIMSHPAEAPATPFVGREPQLRALGEAFQMLDRGRPVLVLVRGHSGIGKTALVQHFLEDACRDRTVVVLAGRCYERESVPYKALDSLMDSLSRYLQRLPLPQAEALLPRDTLQLARLFPVLRCVEAVARAPTRSYEIPDLQELRRRAFAALRELLGRLSDRHRLVLYIDDLQWGDLDSAMMLAALLAPPDPPSLLLVGSYRTEDETTSPFLLEFLRSHDAALVQRHEVLVEPLAADDTRRLAFALLGRADPGAQAQVDAINAEAGGNPFFIAELVQHARARAQAGATSGTVRAISLDDVLWARVEQLPETARRLLEVAAVAGRPLRQADVCTAGQINVDERPHLLLLQAGRLLRRTGSTDAEELETYHDRVRETVVAHLPAQTRRVHHERLGKTLEAGGRADPEVLAMHFHEAGVLPKAADYYAVAAAQASGALAFEHAAGLYRRSLELGPKDAAVERRLRTELGEALANAGRGAEAAQAYLAAAANARFDQALDMRRRAALHLLTSGHLDQGLVVLREILQAVGLRLARTERRAFFSLVFHRLLLGVRGLRFRERPPQDVPAEELARIDIGWAASVGLSMTDNIRAADILTRNLLLALRAGEPSRIARALALEVPHTAGQAGARMKRRGMRLADAAERIARELDDPYLIAFATSARGVGEFLSERWQVGMELIDQGEQILRERCTGVAWELATTRTFSLWSLQKLGRAAEFAQRCPVLLREAQARGDLYAATNLLSFTPFARLMADDPAGARRDIDQAVGLWSHHGYHIQHYALLQARVAVELYTGNGAAAGEFLAAQWPAFAGSFLKRVQVFHVQVLQLFAYSVLASAATAADRAPALRRAEGFARRLDRENTVWSKATALFVRGAVAAGRRERSRAQALLRETMATFEGAGMQLDAAAVRRRLGELVGGSEGQSLVADADTWMANQSIQNPARMVALVAPSVFAPP